MNDKHTLKQDVLATFLRISFGVKDILVGG